MNPVKAGLVENWRDWNFTYVNKELFDIEWITIVPKSYSCSTDFPICADVKSEICFNAQTGMSVLQS
jgi:hypothetical protein